MDGFRVLGVRGLNVTMPHKETVIPFLDGLSAEAKAIGAVNTIEVAGDRLVGHNTDASGFREFLQADAGWDAAGKSALVLGAGGAARAVVAALRAMDVKSIAIAARDAGRAAAALAVGRGPRVIGWDEAHGAVTEADLIVNATPIGMNGEDLLPDATFRSDQTVVDLIYQPPSTRLVERARTQKAEAWSGLGHARSSSRRVAAHMDREGTAHRDHVGGGGPFTRLDSVGRLSERYDLWTLLDFPVRQTFNPGGFHAESNREAATIVARTNARRK